MDLTPLLPDPDKLRILSTDHTDSLLTIFCDSIVTSAQCPVCHSNSSRVHSIYKRNLRDLNLLTLQVCLILKVRKYVCKNSTCPRKIFAERFPSVTDRYARKTKRLIKQLQTLGYEAGGQGGHRLAQCLNIEAGRDTILRKVRKNSTPDCSNVEIVGVDDFSFRKGKYYGTIIIDLEQQTPIDLLPDRTSETLIQWFKKNPQVKIVSRDRGGAYCDAVNRGLPEATQVADRWHLLKNMTERLEQIILRRPILFSQALQLKIDQANIPKEPIVEHQKKKTETKIMQLQSSRRKERLTRYNEVHNLHQKGNSIRQISRELHMSRRTVRNFLRSESFPERSCKNPKESILTPYVPYLRERIESGCLNSAELWREIKKNDFQGSQSLVRSWVHKNYGKSEAGRAISRNQTTYRKIKISSRRMSWLIQLPPNDLTEEQQQVVQKLFSLNPDVESSANLAKEFKKILLGNDESMLEQWIQKLESSENSDLMTFAQSIRKDQNAIESAIKLPWSNGPVEGQINRLKMIKRQMFGRANLDLLKSRVIALEK